MLTHLYNITWRWGARLEWTRPPSTGGATLLSLSGRTMPDYWNGEFVHKSNLRCVRVVGHWTDSLSSQGDLRAFARPVCMCFWRRHLTSVLCEYGVCGPLLQVVRPLYNTLRSLVHVFEISQTRGGSWTLPRLLFVTDPVHHFIGIRRWRKASLWWPGFLCK